MTNKKIRVLIVDDSIFFRNILIDYLSKQPNIQVIGSAINAYDAQEKIPLLNPDVITLDVEMPGLSGIELLKKLLPQHPISVILVSSLNINVFDALSAGAMDFVKKPDLPQKANVHTFLESLSSKIAIAAKANIKLVRPLPLTEEPKQLPISFSTQKIQSTIVAIGASTGGTEAILSILKQLPKNCPGILVTQHMPEGFTKMYAERLDRICKMKVREAKNHDRIEPGLVLIAPGNLQMTVLSCGDHYKVQCLPGEKVSSHCPSVDVLFKSIASQMGKKAIGIILTGMGQDGAHGLLEMKKQGSYTIGQDKQSCVVYGMPSVAYNIGAVTTQAPLEKIPEILQNYLSK